MSLAEEAMEGYCCSRCGTKFIAPHGYPVLCKSCYQWVPLIKEGGLTLIDEPYSVKEGKASSRQCPSKRMKVKVFS